MRVGIDGREREERPGKGQQAPLNHWVASPLPFGIDGDDKVMMLRLLFAFRASCEAVGASTATVGAGIRTRWMHPPRSCVDGWERVDSDR